jgi:hypothetical protein
MGLLTRLAHVMLRIAGEREGDPVPDELLANVQRGVVAAIGALQQQLLALTKQVALVDENATSARSVEKRLESVSTLSSGTRSLLEDHVSRLDQAVNQLRGQVTGGSRTRGRGRGNEAELGAALVQLLGSEERAVQLLAELEQRGASSTPVDSPIGG